MWPISCWSPADKEARYNSEPDSPPASTGARPKALSDGDYRTVVAMAKSLGDHQRREKIASAIADLHAGALPAIVECRESDVSIVCEVANLSIADVAVRLIGERAEFIDYARRVFSRSDIPFEPLTPKDDEEETEID